MHEHTVHTSYLTLTSIRYHLYLRGCLAQRRTADEIINTVKANAMNAPTVHIGPIS
jgi:hypothetical protein